MKKILPFILVLVGVALVYLGVVTYQDATANLDIFGLNLKASDNSGQTAAFVYFGAGIVCWVFAYVLGRR